MVSTTWGHLIFYVALFVIILIAINILIQAAITQVAFWILRPSEMASMDFVGTIGSLGGTTGKIETDYEIYTGEVDYYFKRSDKILCVISQRRRSVDTPVVGLLTTINCFTMPFEPQVEFSSEVIKPDEGWIVELQKTFNTDNQLVNVEKK